LLAQFELLVGRGRNDDRLGRNRPNRLNGQIRPTSLYSRVVNKRSARRSARRMRYSHFTLLVPYQPGTTRASDQDAGAIERRAPGDPLNSVRAQARPLPRT
jgi:hypothetical protein